MIEYWFGRFQWIRATTVVRSTNGCLKPNSTPIYAGQFSADLEGKVKRLKMADQRPMQ
jgi:hypothetical protein